VRSRDGNRDGGIAAATAPGQPALFQAAAPGANANPSTDPSHVASNLQTAAPSAAGTAAELLTSATGPASTSAASTVSPSDTSGQQGLTSMTASMSSSFTTQTGATESGTSQAGAATLQAAHASPVSQVAPALVSLSTSAAGAQRLTLLLHPAELGTVEVRIDRPTDAPAHVDIGVSRPETLTLMLRDQTQLQHALDQAGVPAEGRTLNFHLTGQDPDSLSRQAGGFGQTSSDGQAARNGAAARNAADPDGAATLASAVPPRWQRVGLDITA
jgi:flagellar hook-length control protein FliK